MLKVGDKVVPISKSGMFGQNIQAYVDGFDTPCAIQLREKGHMFVQSIHTNDHITEINEVDKVYVCGSKKGVGGGDFFLEQDLILYDEHIKRMKVLGIQWEEFVSDMNTKSENKG